MPDRFCSPAYRDGWRCDHALVPLLHEVGRACSGEHGFDLASWYVRASSRTEGVAAPVLPRSNHLRGVPTS
jgi:hypothetical protein